MTFRIIRDRTRKFRRKLRGTIIFRGSREEIFTRIFKHNYWGSIESKSGPGSEISYTENLRRELPKLIKCHGITQVLDAPCGDFNWMQYVVQTLNIKYIGGDIVKDLITRNNMIYGSEDIMFQHLDITRDPLPKSDLMVVRDCLFHFSFKDIHRFLRNFHNSNIRFLLTTTHRAIGEVKNYDIVTGDYRKIDLFSTPFCFPDNPVQRITDFIPPHSPREMCLFTKDQVSIAYKSFSLNMKN